MADIQRVIRVFPAFMMLTVTLGAGCASAPRFEPSRPLEAAPSYQEALLLCDEYRMPEKSERPIAFKPFVDCTERIAEDFKVPVAGPFDVFRHELRQRYDLLSEAEWVPRLGVELETAVHAAFRALWTSEPAQITESERADLLRHFPRTARELGVALWQPAMLGKPATLGARAPEPRTGPGSVIDRRLEALRAGISAFSSDAKSSCGPGAVAVESLRDREDYLSHLWRDVRELPPQSELGNRVRSRYRRGVENALKQLTEARRASAGADCPST